MSEKKAKLPRRGKNYSDARSKIDPGKHYSLNDAFDLITKVSFAKFDETVEAVFNLGVDPKQ